MNTQATCEKSRAGKRVIAVTRHCRRSIRHVAAWLLLGIMLFNFIGEGSQLVKIVLARYDLSPVSLIAGIFPRETQPVAKSCCAAKAESQPQSCGCSCCGDHCPMGDACNCDGDGHRGHDTDGLFFTMPGCHPDRDNGAHYLPLSMRVAFVLETPSAPIDFTELANLPTPKPVGLVSHNLKPPVPPPRSIAA